MTDSILMDLHEVASRLGIPYRVVRDNVYSDRWQHRRVSERKRYMTEQDVEAAVADMTVYRGGAHEALIRNRRANVAALLNSVS